MVGRIPRFYYAARETADDTYAIYRVNILGVVLGDAVVTYKQEHHAISVAQVLNQVREFEDEEA